MDREELKKTIAALEFALGVAYVTHSSASIESKYLAVCVDILKKQLNEMDNAINVEPIEKEEEDDQ